MLSCYKYKIIFFFFFAPQQKHKEENFYRLAITGYHENSLIQQIVLNSLSHVGLMLDIGKTATSIDCGFPADF